MVRADKEGIKNDVIGSPYYVNIMQRISFDIPYGKETVFRSRKISHFMNMLSV